MHCAAARTNFPGTLMRYITRNSLIGGDDAYKSSGLIGPGPLSGPLPTELGNYVNMKAAMAIWRSDHTSTIPTELGRLSQVASTQYCL